jgi:hypothetical protein
VSKKRELRKGYDLCSKHAVDREGIAGADRGEISKGIPYEVVPRWAIDAAALSALWLHDFAHEFMECSKGGALRLVRATGVDAA